MPYAYNGKLLRVDLTARHWGVEMIDEDVVQEYLLGSGLAARIFFEEVDPNLEALDPASPLIFMTGLLTGTIVPTPARSVVCGRSPLTGIWNETNFGGYWGAELKFAGYDGMIVTGKAEKPVYLWIHDDEVEIHPADELWGLETYETFERVRQTTDPKARVSCIGPAGEKGVRLAGIAFGGRDTRMAGRGGMGMVMGSKNLKAIAVRGHKRPQYHDQEGLRAFVRQTNTWIKENSMGMSRFGTGGGVPATEKYGDLPLKNWQEGSWEKGAAATSGQKIAETIFLKHYRCYGCPIGCGKDVRLEKGPHAGDTSHGPEYETLAAFGGLLLNDDLDTIAAANDLCNRYGLDTISVGAVVAVAMEAYEKGLLTATEAGGLDLSWGNGETLVQLVEQIGRKEGLGARLGEGSVRLAAELGPEAAEFVIAVKGLGIAMHDPRGFVSMAANYATANRGGCHLEALSYWNGYGVPIPDLGYPEALDRFSNEVGGKMAYDFQNYMSVYNALGLCKFLPKGGVGPETVVGYVNRAMGWQWTADDLLRMGEKLFNLKRMINVRYGIGCKDDILPPRLMTLARPSGSAAGVLPDMDRLLSDYYELRGWNPDGSPGEERLAELGLA
jgi:aldehyde:ferredoxin oxidoreductase